MSYLPNLPILGILDPFIKLMGIIINYIYKFMLLFGVEKVAICIIVFTVVIKLLMLPLTYKQQKFSKVSAQMNPEIQAISEKYKGKRDQESMMKMQQEQQAVYKKYGSSPMSGCLPMLVIMIFLFALYPVVYSIPTYVDGVKVHYEKIAEPLLSDEKDKLIDPELVLPEEVYMDPDGNVFDLAKMDEDADTSEGNVYNFTDAMYAFYNAKNIYVRKAPKYTLGKTTYTEENIIAIMAGFSEESWNEFFNGEKLAEDTSIKNGDIKAWNAYSSFVKATLSASYKKDGDEIVPSDVKAKIVDINTIMGINIFDKPVIKSITILIPLLAALLQFLQSHLTMALTNNKDEGKKKKSTEPSPMDSMKTMNYIMPVFSGIICFSLPIGIGLYWITSSVVSIILQVVINAKLKDVDVQVFVDESADKNKKELEKYGVHNKNDGKMAAVAKTSTKSISSYASSGKTNKGKNNKNNKNVKNDGKIPESKRSLSAGSIAAIANIYKNDESDDDADLTEDSES